MKVFLAGVGPTSLKLLPDLPLTTWRYLGWFVGDVKSLGHMRAVAKWWPELGATAGVLHSESRSR